jgi:integrase
MGRRPKPWYWKARGGWYVTINGQRHSLGPDKEEAYDEFHRLMTQPRQTKVAANSVAAIIDAFLEWCSNNRADDTYVWYQYRLERFAQRYPDLTTRDLKPYHVQEWLDSLDELSDGSKRNHGRTIKRCMRWAEKQGYIDRSPIAHLELPKGGKREVVLSQDEFDRVLSLIPDEGFRDLLVATWETGCRPQESLRVEKRHVDLQHCRWVFPPSEAKGEEFPRIVYLPGRALEITKRLILTYPDDKLFRNTRGRPWTPNSVHFAFERVQIRLGKLAMKERGIDVDPQDIAELMQKLSPERIVHGEAVRKNGAWLRKEAKKKLTYQIARQLGTKYSLYDLRHSWVNHSLARGLDALTVAVLMGHQDPSTMAKVYQHLSHNPSHMLEQARRAAG